MGGRERIGNRGLPRGEKRNPDGRGDPRGRASRRCRRESTREPIELWSRRGRIAGYSSRLRLSTADRLPRTAIRGNGELTSGGSRHAAEGLRWPTRSGRGCPRRRTIRGVWRSVDACLGCWKLTNLPMLKAMTMRKCLAATVKYGGEEKRLPEVKSLLENHFLSMTFRAG